MRNWYGRLGPGLMPAAAARAEDSLPIGLAHGVRLTHPVRAGSGLTCAHIDLDKNDPVVKLRDEGYQLLVDDSR